MNPPIEFGPKIELDYDATELEREYLAGLDVFERRIPVYDGFKLLPGEDLAAFHEACGRARERVGSPFTLMIAGDFKRGKSTLVNALAGCAAVTVDVRPETISINRIEYAADHAVHLVAEDGRKAELLPADLKRERLEEILAHLPARLRHIHIAEQRAKAERAHAHAAARKKFAAGGRSRTEVARETHAIFRISEGGQAGVVVGGIKQSSLICYHLIVSL